MRFPRFERDPKPRMKKGWTFPRLLGFLLALAVLAVIAHHFVEGRYPTVESDCEKREIDSGAHKEGTCFERGREVIVVNRRSELKMGTLGARLLGIQERKTLRGPGGTKTADGEFVTVDVAVRNKTNHPAAVEAGQFVLYLGEPLGEAVEVDEKYEPRSFLSRGRKIPPGGTEEGTVTFAATTDEAESVTESGNFDVANLGEPTPPTHPDRIFFKAESGTIRTYK
jgi:hypothetical protein